MTKPSGISWIYFTFIFFLVHFGVIFKQKLQTKISFNPQLVIHATSSFLPLPLPASPRLCCLC